MITKTYRTIGTGNMVANYTEVKHFCDDCDGTGYKEVDIDEFREYLTRCFFRYWKYWALILEYRCWKKKGTIPCQNCGGLGEWNERY